MALTLLFPPSLGRLKASTRADLLAQTLSRRLGTPVAVHVAESYGALERAVRDGDVALAWAPPSICARIEPRARAILKAVRNGRSSFRAAVVCRRTEPVDLARPDTIRAGWVDPLAAAGHLLPLAFLRAHGVDPDGLAEQRFHGSYRDALLALLGRRCDLAAVYAHDASEDAARRILAEFVGASEVDLSLVGFTGETPADGLILSPALDPDQADRLVVSLAAVTDGSRGPTPLLELFDAETLVPAGPDDYAILREALEPVRAAG